MRGLHRALLVLTMLGLGSQAADLPPIANPAIARAMLSVEQARPKADADPDRPVYHFHAPALWMNDPNGPIYYQGWYHVFYQFNPYADTWGHMHWGHTRSRDLVHWENLPIALWPSEDLGEEHVFSGCCAVPAKGVPTILYTSIHQGKPPETAAEVWAAFSDKDLITWQKDPQNPVLTEAVHGSTKVYDWRDPFLFQFKGVHYLILGGNLDQRHGGHAVVTIYRARDASLTKWEYLGVLFQDPDPRVGNIECPNLFPLGDRWVLIISPHGPVQYFVGDVDFNTFKFHPGSQGILDAGANFYAPASFQGKHGRRMLLGWINGFPPNHGWNGCFSLPRTLSLGPDGSLRQRPVSELRRLRTDHFKLSDFRVDETPHVVSGVQGDCLELYLDAELLGASVLEIQMRRSVDGKHSVPIRFDGVTLEVGTTKIPFQLLAKERTLQLEIFLDKSVLEVYANGRQCITQVIQAEPDALGVGLVAAGGVARVRSFHAWRIKPM